MLNSYEYTYIIKEEYGVYKLVFMSFVRSSGRLCKRYLQGESNVLISGNEVTIVEQKLLKLSTRMTEFLSTRVDLTADEQVIMVTLSLVHIEFMLKLTMGRRTNKNA